MLPFLSAASFVITYGGIRCQVEGPLRAGRALGGQLAHALMRNPGAKAEACLGLGHTGERPGTRTWPSWPLRCILFSSQHGYGLLEGSLLIFLRITSPLLIDRGKPSFLPAEKDTFSKTGN